MKNSRQYQNEYIDLARKMGLEIQERELSGVDAFLPLIEKMRADGSYVIIKFDGERLKNAYTVVASGNVLGERESIRIDSEKLGDGLAYLCVEYAKIAWQDGK